MTRGKHILIIDSDLYRNVGGGQSVYRRLIEQCPEHHWYYFRCNENEAAQRPANTTAIALIEALDVVPSEVADRLLQFAGTWRLARNMAISVAERLGRFNFDVVDVPDYNQLGPFIRPALAIEGCKVGTVALAMHGTLSEAFRRGWPSGQDDGRMLAELRVREHMQFRAADSRYAISDTYAASWQRRIPAHINPLDPLIITGAPDPVLADRAEGAPDLAFIARREKMKGPDLFLDAVWGLDPSSYRRLLLIGPEGPGWLGYTSEGPLRSASRLRGLDSRLEMNGGMAREEVQALLGGRTLLLLPSRHDTFNLMALEAICRGCPVLVSDRAGVAHWLRRTVPALDWTVMEIDCGRGASAAATRVLADYDRYRAAMAEALAAASLQPDLTGLERMYSQVDAADPIAVQTAIEISAQLGRAFFDKRVGLRGAASRSVAQGRQKLGQALRATPGLVPAWRLGRSTIRLLPRPLREETLDVLSRARAVLATPGIRGKLRSLVWHSADAVRRQGKFEAKAFRQIQLQPTNALLNNEIRAIPERTADEIDKKLRFLTQKVYSRLTDRVLLFREMARLERRAGNPLTAATYLLRTLRWTGADLRGDLAFMQQSLIEGGFSHEAAVAAAMFDGRADSQARCAELMADAYARNRAKVETSPLAVLDDRRPTDWQPRACVIASLYNAADKLPTLLGMLSRQSLAAQGGLEVVLVDSNSPGQDRAAFEAFAAAHPELPICYARSAARETIQAAWNRGIKLARAPYLAFLGADEGLHPDALRILAGTLDAEPSIDWAMADSIVTNVDRRGVYDNDIMAYDRTGYRQDLVYLETCYLSWVGALYRRSIHDRFGYYDESFRAAGDTEFKNRIMPHIQSRHVPMPLGIFNNYPEERTTQHPRAEIEDLRAWYLWRSPAGMDYAFGNRPSSDAQSLLRDCFGYRKSYCGHLSTDYDLAWALAEHLSRRADGGEKAQAALDECEAALGLIRRIETMPYRLQRPNRGLEGRYWVYQRLCEARTLAAVQRNRLELPDTPRFDIFNDNRYEQHCYSWSVS